MNVTIEGLHIQLSGVDIISQLNLDVHSGEFLVLLGPSGCGKSTLLHGIAGLIDAHGGRIEIGGVDVTWADPKDRGIGMVFQSYALYPTMTVERNLSFGPRIAGIARDEIARRVQRAASMLHLSELLQRKPAQLSGGQRQRVAIGRALVRQARVFLFDEPLSNLDAKLRADLRRELKQLHKQLGATMIYVTHDQVEAMTLASRIAVMKEGKIQQIGTPSDVYTRPVNMFVAGFLGAPSMNFIEGKIESVDGRKTFVSKVLRMDVSAYAFIEAPRHELRVALGVRPEHIVLSSDRTHGSTHAPQSGSAIIALVEPMGSNQIVWLDAQGVSLAVEVDAQFSQALDRGIDFAIDPSRVSLFELQSQQRI